jgi:hypothetical protein
LVARAHEEGKEGEFCRRAEAVPSPVMAYRNPQHGRGAAAMCGGAFGQWAEPVRPPASVHQPRGTGLGLHASVTAI